MIISRRNLEKDGQRGLEPKGIFYFVESELLYHLYRTLGLNEDPVALRADNFDSMAKTRHWRTSLIDPFASNFVAVFYKYVQPRIFLSPVRGTPCMLVL